MCKPEGRHSFPGRHFSLVIREAGESYIIPERGKFLPDVASGSLALPRRSEVKEG